jgi:hypothetical protein
MTDLFEQLQQALVSRGPEAAIEQLCAHLHEQKDYGGLFYALLMRKRQQLGVSPIPTAPASELPAQHHAAYEEAIRQAGRQVGQLYLQDGNIPQAWTYFRMLGEPEPVRAALEKHQPAGDEDLQGLVQIAFYEGLHPRKGFDWILDRFGLCSAITTLGGQELHHSAADRQYCLGRLVRALAAELRERLQSDIARQEGQLPAIAEAPADRPGVIPQLLQGRDWLIAEDCYHIDLSHLGSVVQMSLHLTPPCPELYLARDLCVYGKGLKGRFQHPGDPPFADLYGSHEVYLGVLIGDAVEEGLAYFQDQVEANDPQEVGTYPAEVLVNLLLRLKRDAEALGVARKYLSGTEFRQLTCPGVRELCQKLEDYQTLAEVAREQKDPVHFLAGLLGKGR